MRPLFSLYPSKTPGKKSEQDVVETTMDSDQEDDFLLEKRQNLTVALAELPYDLVTYLERAAVHADLGYPDLAAGDSYRALLLCDEVRDESFEYHEQALRALESRSANGIPEILRNRGTDIGDSPRLSNGIENVSIDGEGGAGAGPSLSNGIEHLNIDGEGAGRNNSNSSNGIENLSTDQNGDGRSHIQQVLQRASLQCYRNLAISLLLCGCLKSAIAFCMRGLDEVPEDDDLLQRKEFIENMARRRLKVDEVDINDLPDQGLVRREIYPWNDHEPNRFSQETLDFLNKELSSVAPKCEVKVTELPTLVDNESDSSSFSSVSTNKQLGLFAKEDLNRGETVLDEFSILTANNRLKEALCDACSSALPSLSENSTVVGCPDCYDTMFCNEECLSRAQLYHPSVCEKDLDTLAKDPDPKETPNALYLLLLARSLAMAETQQCHPLDLKEIKYIWGDFLPSASNAVSLSHNAPPPPIWTLPFSFSSNISNPLHVLEKMDIDIFASLATYDLWIFNTLYSKFRGTASARVNLRDGRPEVAAVHPLWCLANHDCDPNVQWEWGGQMKLWCREKRVGGTPGGIKAGEEILNHYCDIDLKVQERREWAKGSLGGWCMCERCRREADEEASNGHHVEGLVAGGPTEDD
ncbi:hypothetical protein D0Z07_6373 [Hyphodiscus hymeniophilus]|uniref:SET domain-containing protein n=1 Tax=Hyphodiscus hymeniophilus TaxID=353542 RepID=A0A9P7AUC9_9HELO|nr:hypothetical protein D0Z07_6373 [Hyphodiscus hymeniophilus]